MALDTKYYTKPRICTGSAEQLDNGKYNTFWLVNLEGKRPLGRPRCRREDIIRIETREIFWEGVDWMHLSQYKGQWRAVLNTVIKLLVL
jgi:hypothetical protein